MARIKLTKMNATGNDFLIFDARATENLAYKEKVVSNIEDLSSRKNQLTGGCDQFLILENVDNADIFMRIYNADGSEVDACGNATRAIGWWIANENGSDFATIKTNADLLTAEQTDEFEVTVDMGKPRLDAEEIPLSENIDTLKLPININDNLKEPTAVSMGNPHMVFFTHGISEFNLPEIGPALEHHKLFPKKTNVEFAEIVDRHNINLRVFERGVGETLACGTGACATLVAAVRLGLTEDEVTINVKGGKLKVKWAENNRVYLSGAIEAEGHFEVDLA